MLKIDVAQLAALAELAEALPKITKEIGEIEKSVGRLNALLGEKKRGEPGPKPKVKKTTGKVAKRKTGKKPVGLTEKVLSAMGNEALTEAELKKVDGRANANFLKHMVGKGVLKKDGGKYTKA